MTIALYRPGDPGKNKFCWRGGSPPIWGDMGGLKFSTGVYFDPTFLNSLVRFRNFFAHRQLPPPLGMLKIWSKSDERNSRNVRPKLVPQPSTFAFWPSVTPHSSPYDGGRRGAAISHRSDCPRSNFSRSTLITPSVFGYVGAFCGVGTVGDV